MHPKSAQLALAKVMFLIAETGLLCKDLLISLPVLRHLQFYTRTLLERNCAALDDAGCYVIGNPTVVGRGGNVSHIMIPRLHRVQETNSTTFIDDSERQT